MHTLWICNPAVALDFYETLVARDPHFARFFWRLSLTQVACEGCNAALVDDLSRARGIGPVCVHVGMRSAEDEELAVGAVELVLFGALKVGAIAEVASATHPRAHAKRLKRGVIERAFNRGVERSLRRLLQNRK